MSTMSTTLFYFVDNLFSVSTMSTVLQCRQFYNVDNSTMSTLTVYNVDSGLFSLYNTFHNTRSHVSLRMIEFSCMQ